MDEVQETEKSATKSEDLNTTPTNQNINQVQDDDSFKSCLDSVRKLRSTKVRQQIQSGEKPYKESSGKKLFSSRRRASKAPHNLSNETFILLEQEFPFERDSLDAPRHRLTSSPIKADSTFNGLQKFLVNEISPSSKSAAGSVAGIPKESVSDILKEFQLDSPAKKPLPELPKEIPKSASKAKARTPSKKLIQQQQQQSKCPSPKAAVLQRKSPKMLAPKSPRARPQPKIMQHHMMSPAIMGPPQRISRLATQSTARRSVRNTASKYLQIVQKSSGSYKTTAERERDFFKSLRS